jgi:hypothetical protein
MVDRGGLGRSSRAASSTRTDPELTDLHVSEGDLRRLDLETDPAIREWAVNISVGNVLRFEFVERVDDPAVHQMRRLVSDSE